MKTLYIDTHYKDIHIVLFDEHGILKEEHLIDKKNNSSFIMPLIVKVCGPSDIEQIVVVNGPGSFTGVRLGVTIAKTMAYSLSVPIKVLSYFDILYLGNDSKNAIYGICDNNGYYIKDYNKDNEPKYLSNIEFEDLNKNNKIITETEIDFIKLYNFLSTVSITNPHLVNPLYIKKIGVEK